MLFPAVEVLNLHGAQFVLVKPDHLTGVPRILAYRDSLQNMALEFAARLIPQVPMREFLDFHGTEILVRELAAHEAVGDLPDETPEADSFVGQRVYVPMDIPQTELVFGLSGIARDDVDFFPAFVLNSVLGGGMPETRLEREVRGKRGLAYSIYTYLADAKRAPLLIGATSTRDQGAGETVAVVRDVIRRTAAEGLSAEELADAKRYITGSFPLALDSTSEIAGFLVAMQTNDLGIDYLDRRNGLVEAVTTEEVRRVARRLLVEDAMVWVAVGRSDPFP